MADRTVRVSLTAQVNNYLAGMEQARKATQQAKEGTEDASAAYERQNQAMTKVGIGLTAAGAVAVAATALAVKSAIDWESAWTGVTKTVDGSASEMAALEEELRGLAQTLPATHEEIAAVAEAAGQLGVKRQDITAFTKTMIDLAETTNLSADEAATSIAQLMNVMQTAPEDVDNLGASLVALGNDGASTERDIIQMAQRIAGSGKIIGLTEGEVLGFANALASVGIEAEAGGTAISRIMTDIAKSVSAGGAELEQFASVAGMSSAEFQTAFKEAPAQAIATFIEGLARINASGGDVFKTLSDLGQSDIRVSQALLGMANSGDLLRKSLELGNEAWKDNTALIREAEKRYATTEAKLQVTMNTVRDAAIDFGEVFLPAVKSVAEAVGFLAGGFAALPEPIQGVIGGGAALAGVASLLAGSFLVAVPKVAEFNSVLQTLRTSEMPGVAKAANLASGAITGSGKALAATANFMMGPWGIALGVATAGVLAWTAANEKLRAGAAEFRETLDESTGALTEYSRELIAKKLVEADAFEGAQRAGIAQSELVQALYEQGDLLDDVMGKLRNYNNANLLDAGVGTTINAVREIGVTTRDAKIGWEDLRAANEGANEEAAKSPTLIDGIAASTQTAADETAGLTEEQQKLFESLQGANAAFIDYGGALKASQDKQREWAEQTAEATQSGEDSWQDYYDGFSVNLDEYLAEMQRQIDAQANWEQNMLLLSGRVSEGVLAELATLGPEGAPLVAALVSASDEQLAIMETSFAERSEAGTTAFKDKMVAAAPVIAAAAAQLGQGAAQEIAAKLAAGTATVQDIIAQYKLKVEGFVPVVNVDTTTANAKIDSLLTRLGTLQNTSYPGVTLPNGQTVVDFAALGRSRATGGIIPGPPSNRDNRIYALATGEFVTRASQVAIPENRRALEYMNAGGVIRGFAQGGFVQPQYTSPTPTIRFAAPTVPPVQMPDTLNVYDVDGRFIGAMKVAAGEVIGAAARAAGGGWR